MARYHDIIQAEVEDEILIPLDIIRLTSNYLVELETHKRHKEVMKSFEKVNVIYGLQITPESPIRITRYTSMNEDIRCSYWLLRDMNNIAFFPFFVQDPTI